MKIRRYSASFLAVILLLLASQLVIIGGSFYAQVNEEDYKALGLPILYIETEAGRRINSRENYRNAQFLLEDGDKTTSGSCKIRGRGNSTWETPDTNKKPYLLKLDTAEGLLGMGEAQKWVLFANATDKTFLRNEYAYYLASAIWNKCGWVPQERGITLVVNGRYEGLYFLGEKVSWENLKLPPKSFIACADSHVDEYWNCHLKTGMRIGILRQPDDEDNPYSRGEAYLQIIEDMLFSTHFANPVSGYPKYLDVDSFIDWLLVNEFTKNHDSRFQGSCFMYYNDATKKIHMGPIWDFDISCGNIHDADCDKPEGYIVNTRDWFQKLWQDPAFISRVRSRWMETRMQVKASIALIQQWADELAPAANLNNTVWKTFGRRQWPNAPGWKERKSYQAEVDYMINYLTARFAWLDEQMSYYTLNWSICTPILLMETLTF